MELPDALKETFEAYQCFLSPFGVSDEENDEKTKEFADNTNSAVEKPTEDQENFQEHDHSEAQVTCIESTTTMDPDSDSVYQYGVHQLQRMINDKIKEVEDISAEKEELESTVQSVLRKLWSKEEELHNDRENSYKREQTLNEALFEEKTNCKKLEDEVKELKDQIFAWKDKVCELEDQLRTVDEGREKWKAMAKEQQSKLGSASGSVKDFTEDFMRQLFELLQDKKNKNSRSSSLNYGDMTDVSGGLELKNDDDDDDDNEDDVTAGDSTFDDDDALRSKVEKLWHMIAPDEGIIEQCEMGSEDKLLQEILCAYMGAKTRAVDLGSQNSYLKKKLHEAQEDLCLVEGKMQRLWFIFELYEGEDGESNADKEVGESSSEPKDVNSIVRKIEGIIARNKSTLEENLRLKRLQVSQEETIEKIKKQIDHLKKEETQALNELERKNAKIEEVTFKASKALNDKSVELEILAEQLKEVQEKLDQNSGLENGDGQVKSKRTSLSCLLAEKEHEFDTRQKQSDKEKVALEGELRELQDSLERVMKNNSDLQEYCQILKEKVNHIEAQMCTAGDKERTFKELIEQKERKEEKLKSAMKELCSEAQTRKHEFSTLQASITVLNERVKCLEMEIGIKDLELQLERKNVKNAKETECYLKSSLEKALEELFQLKGRKEEILTKETEHQEAEQPNEREKQQESLMERLKELEGLVNDALGKSITDTGEGAVMVEKLSKENKVLRKEFSECRKASFKLEKTNRNLKALLHAMKEDLVEEMRSKKEVVKRKQELEVFLQRSKEKTHELEDRLNVSHLHDDSEANVHTASTSEVCWDVGGKGEASKSKGKRKLVPKDLLKRFSCASDKAKEDVSEDRHAHMKDNYEAIVLENKHLRSTIDSMKKDLLYDKHVRAKMVEQQHRLRDVLMAIERDKEALERKVEVLNGELQRKEKDLENCQAMESDLSGQVTRNVKETMKLQQSLNELLEKTGFAQEEIGRDIHNLTEGLGEKEKHINELEKTIEQCRKENTSLVRKVETLNERMSDEVALREGALEEARQTRESIKNLFEAKDMVQLTQAESCLADEQVSPRILPQTGKDEARAILLDVLGEIQLFKEAEFCSLKERLSKISDEVILIREDSAYIQSLLPDGFRDEIHRAEEKIGYLTEQLKISREKQAALRETCVEERVRTQEEIEKVYERYTELKVVLRSKEEALDKYKEREEVLISDNWELHEELTSVKSSAVTSDPPGTLESKMAVEKWRRKYEKLQESFEKEFKRVREENKWLHTQLMEESAICEETRVCNARLSELLKEGEEKVSELKVEQVEYREARASLEENRAVLETRVACLQNEKDGLKEELSRERSAAMQSLAELRNEYQISAKHLKRQQQEENNLLTKVAMLEREKSKLEEELKERQRLMVMTLDTYSEERSALLEKQRNLRISLEEEIRRRLELEQKMKQIVNISVMETEQNSVKTGGEESSWIQSTTSEDSSLATGTPMTGRKNQELTRQKLENFAYQMSTAQNNEKDVTVQHRGEPRHEQQLKTLQENGIPD